MSVRQVRAIVFVKCVQLYLSSVCNCICQVCAIVFVKCVQLYLSIIQVVGWRNSIQMWRREHVWCFNFVTTCLLVFTSSGLTVLSILIYSITFKEVARSNEDEAHLWFAAIQNQRQLQMSLLWNLRHLDSGSCISAAPQLFMQSCTLAPLYTLASVIIVLSPYFSLLLCRMYYYMSTSSSFLIETHDLLALIKWGKVIPW